MPTRGRAERAIEARDSHEATKRLDTTELIAVLDAEDGGFELYAPLMSGRFYVTHGNMVERTNKAVAAVLSKFDIVGWTADDQIFRTPGWDEAVVAAFDNPRVGMVMTNDLQYGSDRPVNIYLRSAIPKALGWFAYPKLEHLFVDVVWHDLGMLSGTMAYLEDVVVEHMHFTNAKAPNDPQYSAVHDGGVLHARDEATYEEWCATARADDVRKVRECLGLS